jgi:hypothetical protein
MPVLGTMDPTGAAAEKPALRAPPIHLQAFLSTDHSNPVSADRDVRLAQQIMDLPVSPVVVALRQANDLDMSSVNGFTRAVPMR